MHITDFDRLARQFSETIGYKGGQIAAYDVAGYQRVERHEAAPQTVPQREIDLPASGPFPAEGICETAFYQTRIGGFWRGNLYNPDQAGKLFRESGIAWNDGVGHGRYESLLIDRKYGLNHVLEAPVYGYELPYLDEEWPAFKAVYGDVLLAMITRLREMEAIYGSPIVGRERGVCILNFIQTPLSLFVQAYERNPQKVEALLQAAIGQADIPIEPVSSAERAMLIRFFDLLQERLARIIAYQRKQLAAALGPGTRFWGNFHELPYYDLVRFGTIYDYPAVAVRPLLLEDEVMLRHYVAYHTQLAHDLSGKRPSISIRINLSAAGCRFVPGANLIRSWHDQAVRHGAGGFSLWPRDYPMDQANPFDGMMPANPEPNTLPHIRWQSSLECLGKLSRSRRFILPNAQIGILVPHEAALLDNASWRRIYACFAGCAEARIHTRFLDDRRIASEGVLASVRLIIAPALEFVSPALRAGLESFAAGGGLLLVIDEPFRDQEGADTPGLVGAQSLDPSLVEIFREGQRASLEELQRTAVYFRDLLEQEKLNDMAWLFDVTIENLPVAENTDLREPEPDIRFEHWMYEHGSPAIFPYINKSI